MKRHDYLFGTYADNDINLYSEMFSKSHIFVNMYLNRYNFKYPDSPKYIVMIVNVCENSTCVTN